MPKISETEKQKRYVDLKTFVETEGYVLHNTEFVKNSDRITVTCPNNHEPYEVQVNNFKNGSRCRKCMAERFSKDRMKSYNEVKDYVESFGYKMMSQEYKGSHSKFNVECSRGHKYSTSWTIFHSNGSRCPRCKSSRGENIIRFILDEYKVPYENGYNVRYNNRLHIFDFYLPTHNLYIEHQGEQHFLTERTIRWVGEEKAREQQKFDEEKRKYCIEVNSLLLETTYKDSPKDVHKKLVDTLKLEYQSIDLTKAEYYTRKLDVQELLCYYRWHTTEETAEKFGVSRTQVSRYTKGTGAKIKPVKQMKDGEIIQVFDTQKEAVEILGLQINSCLKGRTKTAGGYEWGYMLQEEYKDWMDKND